MLLAAAQAGPVWADAFPSRLEPAAIHFIASYRGSDGAEHRLEVWRSGSEFLHRRTDAGLDLYVLADPDAAGGYRYRLLDHRRRAMIDVGRANLMRIGVFAEWDGLAHVIAPPHGPYRIEAREAEAAPAGESCGWWRLAPAEPRAASRICWSERWGLPLRIVADDASEPPPRFTLTAVEAVAAGALPRVLPALPTGYDYIDSNADIDPSGD